MIAKPVRTVLDTNVLISAFIKPSSPSDLAITAAFRRSEVLISAAIFVEFGAVLLRTKFARYGSTDLRFRYLQTFRSAATMVAVVEAVNDCRDVRDNMFLEAALSGQANFLVSGDTNLLCLHPWRGIDILSPVDYLSRIG